MYSINISNICLPTKYQITLKELQGATFKDVRVFRVKLEFESFGFCRGRKTGEQPLEQGREPTRTSSDFVVVVENVREGCTVRKSWHPNGILAKI